MLKRLPYIFGLVLMLALAPIYSYAQEPLDETYVYLTGEYQVDYPSAWVVNDTNPTVTFASDAAFFSGDGPAEGGAGIALLAPVASSAPLFAQFGEEAAPQAVAESISGDFSMDDAPPSRSEAITLGDYEGYVIEITQNSLADYMVIALDAGAPNPVVFISATAIGELDTYRDTLTAIAGSLVWDSPVPAFSERLSEGETQEGADLGVGALAEGQVAANESTSLSLYAEAEQVLQVRVAARGEGQPELSLLSPDGDTVQVATPGFGGTPATVVAQIPATGVYQLQIGDSSGADIDFVIEVEALDVELGGGPISYGETGSGFILNGDIGETWTFSGSAGDVVTITVEGEVDSYLELSDAEGTLLAEDDDSGAGLSAQIQSFELPADGDYTIRVRGFSQSSTGVYSLSLATE